MYTCIYMYIHKNSCGVESWFLGFDDQRGGWTHVTAQSGLDNLHSQQIAFILDLL